MSIFDSLCSCCSSNPQPGKYAFEAYRKLPFVGGLLDNFPSSLQNMGGLLNIGQTIGGFTGGNGGKLPFGNQGGLGNENFVPNTGGMSGFNPASLLNNTPLEAIKASESNYNQLINNNSGSVVKQVLKSNYTELVKKYKENGEKFTDPDFPPIDKSIGNVEDLTVKASWKRIPDAIKNAQFVEGKIEPSDIFQGSLGDCYFLSAISSLAEKDFRIKNLFPNLETNPNGIYMAKILHNGVLKEVVVDDYIPVTPQGAPLFARPAGGNQFWVIILEKCWAKVNGSYGAIVGGLPNEVLHAFSGAPTFYRPIPDGKNQQEELWSFMSKSQEKGGIMCCGTKGDDAVEKCGFVKGHAYTILGIFDKPYRLLKIRNPWGQKEWTGRASDSDNNFWSKISAADKQKLGYSSKNDGIFFMHWEDFVNYFDMVDVCKIDDNASYVNCDSEFDRKNGNMYELTVKQTSNVTLTLAQSSLRGEDEGKKASRTTLIVAKYDEKAAAGSEYTYVKASTDNLFTQHYLELPNLESGAYVIFAKADWITTNPNQATVSVYTTSPSLLIKSKQSNHKEFLHKVFLDHARKNPKKQLLNPQWPKEWVCSDLLMNESGYGYLVVHLDETSQRKIGVELNQSEYTERRLILKKPYKGKGTIKIALEAGKELIVLFRLKSLNYPSKMSLPTPKFYNLV